MKSKALANAAPQLIFGAFIIVVGCLFLFDNLGMIDAGHFFDYWPSVFVIIGLIRLTQAESGPGRFVGFVIALIGFLWILENVEVIKFRLWDYWPVALMVVGGAMIWKTLTRAAEHTPPDPSQAATASGCCPPPLPVSSDVVNGVAVLGGFKRIVNSPDFRGGSLTACLGGCEIDLRDASISSGEAVIDALAFWGGIELKVPEDWVVEIHAMPLLGGIEDKTKPPRDRSKRLVIKGMAIMGGIEIRN